MPGSREVCMPDTSDPRVLDAVLAPIPVHWYKEMTLDELEREYVELRQQAEAVRRYL
jgi:hypothetical protein